MFVIIKDCIENINNFIIKNLAKHTNLHQTTMYHIVKSFNDDKTLHFMIDSWKNS